MVHSSNGSLLLFPTYRVSGTVSVQKKVGKPLKDVAEAATLNIYEATNQGMKYIKTIYTDEKGAYSVNLNSGKIYRIEA